MKARMKTVLCGSATVFAFTVLSSTVVFAAPSTDSNNIEDSVWSYRAVADVDTQVNIRANASTKSEIVGYLPKGASADLIEKGEKWSHIISNGVEGYIKNDYLAYGEDAEYLANVYGTQGVKVNWDGVNLFSSPDAAADILDSADNGSEYSLISEDGDWYQVQMDAVHPHQKHSCRRKMHAVPFVFFKQEIFCKILIFRKTSDLWIINSTLIEKRPHDIADFLDIRPWIVRHKLLHPLCSLCRIIQIMLIHIVAVIVRQAVSRDRKSVV